MCWSTTSNKQVCTRHKKTARRRFFCLQSRIKAWQVRQVQQERLGQQQLERLQEQRQRQVQQERLEQQQLERLQEQRLLLFCRKRSKQQRPTKRRTKRIWSW
jgi:hypothetical protein